MKSAAAPGPIPVFPGTFWSISRCFRLCCSMNMAMPWPAGRWVELRIESCSGRLVGWLMWPPRPGATLWSMAAGPLVNVVLFFVLTLTGMLGRSHGWFAAVPNIHTLVRAIWYINLGLLTFNLLPIYPLDGGQILRSLLWFVLGRARSLMVAVSIGFIGVAGLIALALWIHSAWFVVLSFFILMNCWGGLKQARALSRLAKLPRREGFTCPCCKLAPPIGAFWKCAQCGQPFDTFETQAVCPKCNARFAVTGCLDCRRAYPMNEWMAPALVTSAS